MIADRFESRLPELLTELSQPRVPDYFTEILRETGRARQRPRWSFPERWLPVDITAQASVGARNVPWRTLGLVALLVLALVAAVIYVGSLRQPAPLFGPAGNGSVIISRDGDIYVAGGTFDGDRLLIGGPEEDIAARFSRDGLTIHFGRVTAEGTVVMAADADGTNVRRASETQLHENLGVEVSPDGTRLLVLDTSTGPPRLVLQPLTGGGGATVLDLQDITPRNDARWRPGTQEIVFNGFRTTTSMLGLYAIRPDGAGLRTLLEVPNAELVLNEFDISEDGRLLTYWNLEPDAVPGRTCNVHVLDLTTGIDRRLLFDTTAECEASAQFHGPDRLVLERSDVVTGIVPGMTTGIQLLVVPVDGSGPGRLIGDPWEPDLSWGHEFPVWWEQAPDGSSVLFVTKTGDSRLISIADGTSRPVDLVVGDFVSWQRLPLEPD